MSDRVALERLLMAQDPEALENIIASLENFENSFAPDHVIPGSIVLMNLHDRIPNRPAGVYEIPPRMVVGRVVYRLLRSLKDPHSTEGAVRAILPELNTLALKFDLLLAVGHRKDAGHRLIDETIATSLEKDWRDEVRNSSAAVLAQEKNLLYTLHFTQKDALPGEPALVVPDTADVTMALLRSSRSTVSAQSMDSRAVRQSKRLDWDTFLSLLGSDAELHRRIRDAQVQYPTGEEELFKLAEKYIGGWRPKQFMEDDELL
jgi:hypothetical protein